MARPLTPQRAAEQSTGASTIEQLRHLLIDRLLEGGDLAGQDLERCFARPPNGFKPAADVHGTNAPWALPWLVMIASSPAGAAFTSKDSWLLASSMVRGGPKPARHEAILIHPVRLLQQSPRNCSQQRRGLADDRGGLLQPNTP